MKITIDTEEKYVLVEDDDGKADYPTSDPAEVLFIVADRLVQRPFRKGEEVGRRRTD